ncbi:glycosyltransferase [Cohnella yongneupensis]|uniref:Glycosyltransferase n=1 Tax=Cohnella yongneupensis TaxID=425006 RepID=A0ABW0R1B8_9BACL
MGKFLLACHQFFPRFYTGTETLTLEVAEELRRLGHDVAILTTEPILPGDTVPEKVECREESVRGITVWKLVIPEVHDPIKRLESESNDPSIEQHVSAIINSWKPDIVHCFHLMRLTQTFAKVVKQHRIPFCLTVTDFWVMCPTYQLIKYNNKLCSGPSDTKCFSCLIDAYTKGMAKVPVKFKVAKRLPRIASRVNTGANSSIKSLGVRINRHKDFFGMIDGVVWSNPFIQSIFHDNKFQNKNEYIIPFPIPEQSRGTVNLPLAKKDGVLKVAFIGTLRPSKGPQILLQAARHLKDETNIEYYIWGAAENEKFEMTLKELSGNSSQIHYCGVFPQEKFADVLRDIHVVVIPSIWYENTPLTALSVLAAKRILVVSDLGGLSSLVESGTSGYTFPAGDYKALADTIKHISDNRHLIHEISTHIKEPLNIARYVQEMQTSLWREVKMGAAH